MFCLASIVESSTSRDTSPKTKRYQECLDDKSDDTLACASTCKPPRPISPGWPKPLRPGVIQ